MQSLSASSPRQLSFAMARRFEARHRARADMSCCPPQSGGHQLNGADIPTSSGLRFACPLGWAK